MTESMNKEIAELMTGLGENARDAARRLATLSSEEKNGALQRCATVIHESRQEILAANDDDMRSASKKGLSAAMQDRLLLTNARIDSIIDSIESIAGRDDPIGQVMDEWERPNGLRIQRVRVPLGVIGVIFESRPNVTVDAGVLCLKSGNAAILRGGSESLQSNKALHACMSRALGDSQVPNAAIQLVPTPDRDAVGYLLSQMSEFIDVVVPRGGRGLVARVQADARVPVIGHLEGVCHVYVHKSADREMARDIVLNAKMRRTGICGAAETLLIDASCIDTHLSGICDALIDANCELRGDEKICSFDSRVVAATADDWSCEYLDSILSIKAVEGINDAVAHIEKYGTAHTESIVAEDLDAVRFFQANVDSAIVLHNASTQFADGGEFGLGAEIGIATGRVHARGPVGAEQLTSFKYLVHGSGQVRQP